MRNLKIVSSSVFFFWVLLTLTGCKKEKPEDTTPFIVTSKTVEVYSTIANVGGNVTSDGGAPITEKGICYSTSSNPDINSNIVLSNSQLGGFEVNLVNLNPQTNYFARAFAKNKNGVSYGNTVSFTTSAPDITIELPTVTTGDILSITVQSAIGSGNIISDGGGAIISRGLCWSTQQNPTLSNPNVTGGTSTGTFNLTMSNLTPSTTYYVRAFATNAAGTSFGANRTFTTLAPNPSIELPTVTTGNITSITAQDALGSGNITSDGGGAIISRGLCWSTQQNPTLSNPNVTGGTSTGTFNLTMNNLTPLTTYYVRAFATNAAGTSFGNQITFTTIAEEQLFNSFDEPCSAGILLEELSTTDPINNFNATQTVGPIGNPTCGFLQGSQTKDIWLKFQAPVPGDLTINGVAGTITDAAMEIYQENGSCNSLILINCDDDTGPGNMPQLTVFVNGGQYYYIRLWDYGGDNEGDFYINLTY
jgi:hypothetical protein